jgi:hypothetical protein
MRVPAPKEYPSGKKISRHCTLGLIGLAITVALWGTGYKLSLYRGHAAGSSPFPVARMWTDQRNASIVAACALKAKSHPLPGSEVFSDTLQSAVRLRHAVACSLPVCMRYFSYFNALIPFRSPPHCFLQA